jgi:hypothetical protein
MTDPADSLVEQLLQAAYDHGTVEGADVEAGDLQEMLRAAWALLVPAQRAAFFRRAEITTLIADFHGRENNQSSGCCIP